MGEQHLDQRFGAVAFAEAVTGLIPEAVVGVVKAPEARAPARAVALRMAPGLAAKTSR